jgi:hypothetical protein
MTTASEPANNEWVAVQLRSGAVRVFQRLDHLDEDGRRWWMDGFPDQPGATSHTWPELCELGPVAYVGAFVLRT